MTDDVLYRLPGAPQPMSRADVVYNNLVPDWLKQTINPPAPPSMPVTPGKMPEDRNPLVGAIPDAASAAQWLVPEAKAAGAATMMKGVFAAPSKAAINAAELLERAGQRPETIKRWMGVERGADDMWRKEISDFDSKLNMPMDTSTDYSTRNKSLKFGQYKMGDILDHPDLYKNYPEAKDLMVHVEPTNREVRGTYHPDHDPDKSKITLNSRILNGDTSMSTLLHEVQHYVQHKEGFPLGTPVGEQQDKLVGAILRHDPSIGRMAMRALSEGDQTLADNAIIKARREEYARRAHEVEARNTQARMDMDKAARRNSLAVDTEDRDRTEQHILDYIKGTVSKVRR